MFGPRPLPGITPATPDARSRATATARCSSAARSPRRPGRQPDRGPGPARSRCAAAASRGCGRSATARTSSCASVPRAARNQDAATDDAGAGQRDAQRAAPVVPGAEHAARPAALELGQRRRAPQDVAGQLGLLARQPAREVDGGDGLVDRVGGHVLVEELGRARRRSPAGAGPWRSGGWASRTPSRRARDGRRSRRASGGAGRRTT